jgi:hypothetical protein
LCGFEVTVDGDIDILIETGIAFETRFGVKAASDDTEIMAEEPDSPFEGGKGMVMFEGVGTALGLFDELAVCHASRRPGLWEVVGIELEVAVMFGCTADDDMFAVFIAFFDGVHGTPVGFI